MKKFFWFNRNAVQKNAPVQMDVVEESPVVVPMELMDAVFDRSAGRWCDVCKANGSHHTDRHNQFAEAALAAGVAGVHLLKNVDAIA